MFASAIGIKEDPVTGNGNGPLGAYLVKYELAAPINGELDFLSLQGKALGRAGIARVVVRIDNGEPVSVKVGGEAIIVFRFDLELSGQGDRA